jgi:hypothetical protein
MQPEPRSSPQPGPGPLSAASERARPGLPGPVRWALLGIALAILVGTELRPGSWADASRLATIESLAERGTLAIDGSTYFWQGDKVRFDGRYYSHQPPMLALLGALPYALLHHLFGLSIDSRGSLWGLPLSVPQALTWLLVGLPTWLGLWALAHLLRRFELGARTLALLLLGLFAGSLLLPYALVLNQHAPAGALAALAWLAIERGRYAAAGLALSVAATMDLGLCFPAALALWPVALAARRERSPRPLASFIAAALPPLALYAAINLSIAGDLRPFGLHSEAFRYALSPFLLMSLTGVGEARGAGEGWNYALHALFGHSGLFSHHPLLLWFAGLGAAAALRGRRSPLAPGLLAASVVGSLLLALYYLTSSRNFGGSSFGMRWFVAFCPAFGLWAALGLRGRRIGLGQAALALALGLWSSAAALLGAVNPWTKVYYTYASSPIGMAALPEDPRPESWGAHLEAEWRRIQQRQPLDKESYDQTFQRMLDQLRKFYLRPAGELPEAARRARAQEGLDKLLPVIDLMDREAVTLFSRPVAHFWEGKFQAALGDPVRARRAYEAARRLAPTWPPPQKALERLDAVEAAGE